MVRIGIYGYECTRKATFDTFSIIPRYTDFRQVKSLASAEWNYHLTAFLEIPGKKQFDTDTRNLAFDLGAVLSFIDHKDVIIANFLNDSETYENLSNDFPLKLVGQKRHDGGGQVIESDTFAAKSRGDFIELALSKLSDKSDPNNDAFRQAFFKSVEVFRARKPYIDISYYLLFSGLESLSRSVFEDYSSNAARPICNLLKRYGFNIEQDNANNLQRAVSTYTHLRNAMFHNGEFEKRVNINGEDVVLKLTDYCSQFEQLVPLALIKYINFDDGHVNWESWIDGMPFKQQ